MVWPKVFLKFPPSSFQLCVLWLWDVTRWPIVPMSDLSLVIRSSSPQNLLHNWRGASLQTFTWEIPRDDSSTRCHYFPSSSGKASFGRFLWKEKRIKREQVNFDWTTWIRIKNHRMNLASCMMHSQDEPRQRWKTLKLVLNCHNLNWVESAAQRGPQWGCNFHANKTLSRSHLLTPRSLGNDRVTRNENHF